MKCGKVVVVDGNAVEYLMKGGGSVVDQLVRIFNVCMVQGAVPEDWHNACITQLYRGKRDKSEYSVYNHTSLLSVPGKW